MIRETKQEPQKSSEWIENTSSNLEEMDKFLDTCGLPKRSPIPNYGQIGFS